jgi:hypothetical protein
MGTEITQRDVYDRIAAVDTKVETLIARMDERLDHGSRKLDDHEGRLRLLEQAKWKSAGAAAAVGTVTGGVAGSLLSWLLSRHP